MRCIVIDWGSSNFRAHLVDDGGHVVCTRSDDCGVLNCGKNYQALLLERCGDWLQRWPQVPLYLCGMIGSRNGWREAPYAPCPANAAAIAQQLLPLGELPNAWVVPGVSCMSPGGAPDVMRGEESQVLGALQLRSRESAVLLLPGTHSKWVRVENGRIIDFATFFTGELFALLHRHSSIGSVLGDADSDPHSFIEGLRHSRRAGGPLHQMFAARALALCEPDSGLAMSAFLSGLLVGNELAEALTMFPAADEILLLGSEKLQNLYRLAADEFGIGLNAVDPSLAVVKGVTAICDAQQQTLQYQSSEENDRAANQS
ncbi:2-dehydro-3-deoxygalactonokinase [Microbulbifer sp. SAOS-129_SWC]|uniref:2-dehydro-3-deoxygalactonokinase n=1 Tax=Microbulbifer sp. SAOS-129_SWC TaxID=3145235 RepID=UPI00321712C7